MNGRIEQKEEGIGRMMQKKIAATAEVEVEYMNEKMAIYYASSALVIPSKKRKRFYE